MMRISNKGYKNGSDPHMVALIFGKLEVKK
jgi:hypothetical protein